MAPDLELSDEQRRQAEADNQKALEREGLKPGVVEEWEDSYRTSGRPDAFEWWYFDAKFEGGWTAVVVFSTKPMTKPGAPLKPSAQMIIHDPDGKRMRLGAAMGPDDLEASTDSCEVRIGPSHVKGDLRTYVLHAEGEGAALDLTFERGAPSWRPGAGMSYFDKKKDKYLGWVVPIPYGTVAGTITVDGKAHEVKGTGYHDHNWGNISPGLGIDHWYWGRAHVGEFSMIFVEIVSAKAPGIGSLKVPSFYLARGDQIITDDAMPMSLVTRDYVDGPGGRPYPRVLDWQWHTPDGDIEFNITNPALIETINVLEDIPRWEQALIHLFAKPLYYDFNADIAFKIDYAGIKAEVEGSALYEIMMLR